MRDGVVPTRRARSVSTARPIAGRLVPALIACAAAAVLLIAPLYLDAFALRLGFAVCGAAIGAIGLTILTGATGQLSLAHAFFLAVGAFSYSFFASPADPDSGLGGWGMPPEAALVAAVALTALIGLLVSPLSSRLGGLNLGIATLALVFVGQHLLSTLTTISGGFQGRSTPPFSLFGFPFSAAGELVVFGVPFGRAERLWYLGVALLVLASISAALLLRGRPGRAFRMIRDDELHAAVTGIDLRTWKGRAFVISSAYAGLSGVLYALFIGSVAPVSFALDVSVQYLVMIVIGGLGSVGGAVVGAAFVTGLPLLLQRVAGDSDLIDGLSPAALSRYIYAGVMIGVLLLFPGGFATLWSRGRGLPRFATALRLRSVGRRHDSPPAPHGPAQSPIESEARS
ncbi:MULTISPECIES: branched-chain amino acid ABC transporter permease [unclassified Microbacterium]|uniref:branched-chain amino acid ABC transporter permease n=1 Tax=unclassified Microbacterium TaxID=2609290 RepID=UPI00301760C5